MPNRPLKVLAWFVVLNTLLFWFLGLHYLKIIFASKTYFATTFYQYTNLLGKSFVVCFSLCTYLSYFALLAALPYLIILGMVLVSMPKKIILVCSILIATASAMFLLIDTIVFSLFHFHANLMLIHFHVADTLKLFNFMGISSGEIKLGILVSLGIVILESGFMFCAHQLQRLNPLKFYIFNLSCFVFSYLMFVLSIATNNNVLAQQTPNLPLYNALIATLLPFKNSKTFIDQISETRFSQPMFVSDDLHYPLHPLKLKKALQPLNILMIGIDTWRFDAMDKNLTPNIFALAKNAWTFKSHLSGGNSTQAGLFSLFYSLPSSYWTSMLNAARRPIFFDALAARHYETNIIFSSDISLPPFDQTIFKQQPNLQNTLSPGTSPNARDAYVTHAFQQFLAHRKRDQPFFSFLLYDSAHSYCQTQNLLPIFAINKPACSRFVFTQSDVDEAFNHYKNAVHFVDEQVQAVLTSLQLAHLEDNTVVIITGDHGEEFNDSGFDYWGHGSNYTAYQVRTPLIVRWPHKAARVINYPTHHYDVMPTLLQDVLHCENVFSDYSVGRHLLDQTSRPFALVGSYINMGIVTPTLNMTLLTSGGVVANHNLVTDKAALIPDTNILAQALMQMRQYYQPLHLQR